MIGPLGTQTDAGSVVQPEPASFGLLGGNLQPLAPPDALDPFVVDDPTRLAAQKRSDTAVAVATIATGEFDDVLGQLPLVIPAMGPAPLRRAMLAEGLADPAFGDLLRQNRADVIDAGAATRGA